VTPRKLALRIALNTASWDAAAARMKHGRTSPEYRAAAEKVKRLRADFVSALVEEKEPSPHAD
jgi:hypothetical protein